LSDQETLLEKLQEVKNIIKGLSMEVEGMRLNNNSTGDFIQVALRDLLTTLNKLQASIK
jgi:hypothetical protein